MKNDIFYCLYKGDRPNKKYFGLHKIENIWTPNTYGNLKENAYHFLLRDAKDLGAHLKCNIEKV